MGVRLYAPRAGSVSFQKTQQYVKDCFAQGRHEKLTDAEQRVLRLRYINALPLSQVAELMYWSQSGATWCAKNALGKL